MATPLPTESIQGAVPPAPRTPAVIAAEKRLESTRLAGMLVIGVYGFASLFVDLWPVNWINMMQQRVFGSYSPKMSFVLFLFVAVMVQTLVWAKLGEVVTRRIAAREPAGAGSVAASPTPRAIVKPPMSQSQTTLRVGAGFIVVIWIVAAGAGFWFDRQQHGDNEAVYAPLAVDGDLPAAIGLGDHVSVQGLAIGSRVVTYQANTNSTSPSYTLIPLVGPGWKPGDAAHVLLQVKDPWRLPGYKGATRWVLPERVLGRVIEGTSLIERSEFERVGVPLAADHRLLEVVDSQGGKPVQGDVDYLKWSAVAAAFVSGMVLLMGTIAFFRIRQRERRELARPGAAPR